MQNQHKNEIFSRNPPFDLYAPFQIFVGLHRAEKGLSSFGSQQVFFKDFLTWPHGLLLLFQRFREALLTILTTLNPSKDE